MGSSTGIEWTDATWNPWQGCIKVSPGCKFCYMYRDKKRYGQDAAIVRRSSDATFNQPVAKYHHGEYKIPPGSRVFTCSWSDWFIEDADAWREDAWAIIRQRPDLTFQILTKRPERIAQCLPADWGDGYPNVWLGVSVETPDYAWRVAELVKHPAAVRFISAEPLLEDISWRVQLLGIGWVICGGESGSRDTARYMNPTWAGLLREQCAVAGVPFFMKQITYRGRKIPWEQWPVELQVRQFP